MDVSLTNDTNSQLTYNILYSIMSIEEDNSMIALNYS